MHSVGCCIRNYQDGRVPYYHVSNISGTDTDVFMFVPRWYMDMFTAIVTYSCKATDIFIELQFSKCGTPEYDVNARS